MATKKTVAKKTSPARATRKTPTSTARNQVPKKAVPARAPSSAKGTNKGASAQRPSVGLRVRMYRVGFGDFFLLTVPTSDGPKHILIDCGVHSKDIGSITAAVDQMAQETNYMLALVIMTHRHADHISGFSKCKDVFMKFNVERVWMSWFEDPTNKTAVAFQASITAAATQLQKAFALRASPVAEDYLNMVGNITGVAADGSGGTNQAALNLLHSFPGNPPIDYYQAGDLPTLPPSLRKAGLSAKVLGPPIDDALIKKMSKKSEEYLASSDMAAPNAMQPFAPAYSVEAGKYVSAAFELLPRTEMEKRIKAAQPDVLEATADQANNYLNNQSLVVLFTFSDKNLLFAGDAQWGNWANFLFGSATGTTLTGESKTILGKLDFYKVGHHGSTNATPKDAVDAMREGCVAMCSTAVGAYSEVPRGPLLDALEKKTNHQLVRSDQVAAGKEQAVDKAFGKVPAVFSVTSNDGYGYIDYEL